MINRRPRISARKKNTIIRAFVMDFAATDAAKLARVHRNTANLWYKHFRELIYFDSRQAPRLFGEVEVDQALFGGRGRKRMQALLERYARILPHGEYMKKAREIRAEHKVQVLGFIQRRGRVYTHIIESNSKDALEPVIRLVVEQGSTIFSDKWRSFSKLASDGYQHRTINHSEEYITREGWHINGIEAFWSFAKRRLGQFNGIARTTLPLHIKECEFRYNHKEDFETALKRLLAPKRAYAGAVRARSSSAGKKGTPAGTRRR